MPLEGPIRDVLKTTDHRLFPKTALRNRVTGSRRRAKAKVRVVGTKVMEGADDLVKTDRMCSVSKLTQPKSNTRLLHHRKRGRDKKMRAT